jgi:hypothetical protein
MTFFRIASIYCYKCGKSISAASLRCQHCHQWLRSFWPFLLCGVVIVVDIMMLVFYMWRFLPTLASRYNDLGAKLQLPIRIAISICNWFYQWYILISPVVVLLLVISACYKPECKYLEKVVFTFTLLLTLAIAILLFFSLDQAVCIIPVISRRP